MHCGERPSLRDLFSSHPFVCTGAFKCNYNKGWSKSVEILRKVTFLQKFQDCCWSYWVGLFFSNAHARRCGPHTTSFILVCEPLLNTPLDGTCTLIHLFYINSAHKQRSSIDIYWLSLVAQNLVRKIYMYNMPSNIVSVLNVSLLSH